MGGTSEWSFSLQPIGPQGTWWRGLCIAQRPRGQELWCVLHGEGLSVTHLWEDEHTQVFSGQKDGPWIGSGPLRSICSLPRVGFSKQAVSFSEPSRVPSLFIAEDTLFRTRGKANKRVDEKVKGCGHSYTPQVFVECLLCVRWPRDTTATKADVASVFTELRVYQGRQT